MQEVDVYKLSDDIFDFVVEAALEVISHQFDLLDPHADKNTQKIVEKYFNRPNFMLSTSTDCVYPELWGDFDLEDELNEINSLLDEDEEPFFGYVQVQVISTNENDPDDNVVLAAVLFPLCSYEQDMTEQLQKAHNHLIVEWLPQRNSLD